MPCVDLETSCATARFVAWIVSPATNIIFDPWLLLGERVLGHPAAAAAAAAAAAGGQHCRATLNTSSQTGQGIAVEGTTATASMPPSC